MARNRCVTSDTFISAVQANLYHLNLEEAKSAASPKAAMPHMAHVHLADSNRLEPGLGQIDFASLARL